MSSVNFDSIQSTKSVKGIAVFDFNNYMPKFIRDLNRYVFYATNENSEIYKALSKLSDLD